MRHDIPPLHDWHRHHPTAHRLAGTLDGCLHLRTRALVRVLQIVHGVSQSTAMKAVSIARKGAP